MVDTANASAAQTNPGARWGAAMTYDAADGYVLLFSGASKDDSWAFSDGVWTKLAPSTEPLGRDAASMAYDPRDGYVVLFGGGGKPISGSANTTGYRDTWKFLHGSWTNITPTTLNSSNSPSSRSGAAFAYDSEDGYMLLFGGDYHQAFWNDTWTFADGEWTNISATAGTPPSCRYGAGMADDPAEGYVLLFGGDGKVDAGEGPFGCSVNATTVAAQGTWSFVGGRWSELSPVASPPVTWNLMIAYDAVDRDVVLFGGTNQSKDVATQQTWVYAAGNWTQVVPPGLPSISPPTRFSGSMAYDVHDEYVILYGGLSQPEPHAPILGDVWAFRGSVWQNLTPNPIPPFRSSMAMTYDVKDGCVVLFGGLGSSGPLADTWRYSAGTWVELAPPTAPAARYGASITYDGNSVDQFVLLFGGVNTTRDLGDTWAFTRDGWTNLTNASEAPSPRFGAAMAYDSNPSVQRVVLFGGQGQSGALADTWLFLNGTWTPDPLSSSPPGRSSASLAYDAAVGDDYLVLFGGRNGSTVYGDTWEFTNQEQWTEISPSSPSTPPPRYRAALVFDSAEGFLVLFGGAVGGSVLNDTWAYLHGSWTELSFTLFPPGRLATGFVFDSADGFALLFSGAASTASKPLPRTDLWAFSSGAWTNITATQPHLPAVSGGSSTESTLDRVLIVELGVVAVVAVALALLVHRKRSASTDDAPPGPTGSPEPPPAPTDASEPPPATEEPAWSEDESKPAS